MRRVFVTGGSGFVGRRLIPVLVERAVEVRALGRSAAARQAVAALGATPVAGDLDEPAAVAAALAGCDTVFHLAAVTDLSRPRAEFIRVNADATKILCDAALAQGGVRFVHCSTEAVLVGNGPLVNVDETRPRLPRPPGLYPLSKALAEEHVLAAARAGLDAVIVRPRFIWGKGDNVFLPRLLEAIRARRWMWLGGGAQLTSTCHVANVVEGLLLAAERGARGEIYFLTDGEPVAIRPFMTALAATQGVTPPDKTLSFGAAYALATVVEAVWPLVRLVAGRKEPPITRTAVLLVGQEMTVDDRKARRELGYRGAMTREAGLQEMRA